MKIFNGRINRKNYILGLIMSFVFIGFYISIAFATSSYYHGTHEPNVLDFLILLTVFILLILNLVYIFSLHIRRLHDLGLSGLIVIALMIPMISTIITICLMIIKGNDSTNIYGNPVAPDAKLFDVLLNRNK